MSLMTLLKKDLTSSVPQPTSPVVMERPDQEYKDLAKKLSIPIPPTAIRDEFRSALRELGLPIYDNAEVNHYLFKICPKDKHWAWVGLRPQDQGQLNVWSVVLDGQLVHGPYNKAIPYPVMLTVEKVLDKYPKANFFVSDFTAKSPDPFLAVCLERDPSSLTIIERWDEPGFRPKK